MTKWYNEHIRKMPRREPPPADNIVLTDNNNEVKSYECSNCQHIIKTRKIDGTISCPNCTAELVIEDTRKKSKLEIPRGRGGKGSNDIYVGTTPDPVNSWEKKGPELKGGFLALSKKGVHFTSYYDSSYGKKDAD